MFGIGMQELMIILVLALLVLGPTKLPSVARTIGKGMREIRRASDDLRTAMMVDLDDSPPKSAPAPPFAGELPRPVSQSVPSLEGERVDVASAPDDGLPMPENGTVARGAMVENSDEDPHAGMPYAADPGALAAAVEQAKRDATPPHEPEPVATDDTLT